MRPHGSATRRRASIPTCIPACIDAESCRAARPAVEAQQRAVIAVEFSLLEDDFVGSARRRHAVTAIAWAEADLDLISRNRAVFADCLRITASL